MIRKTIAKCKWNFTFTRSCLDPVLSSVRARNAQGITITIDSRVTLSMPLQTVTSPHELGELSDPPPFPLTVTSNEEKAAFIRPCTI